MKRLNDLPEITDDMLGGLHATQELKQEILRDAQRVQQGERVQRDTPWSAKPRRTPARQALRSAAALACLALFVGGILIGIPGLMGQSIPGTTLINTQTAGEDAGLTGGRATALDIPKGSVVISQNSQLGYRGVWEAANSANFPLVRVDGRYYRMMASPLSASADLLGDALGTVETYTSEPALVSSGTVSNAVAAGETVYALRNMQGAAVAARVNGAMRVFQRVSYGSTALQSSEELSDTLGAVPVVELELAGVGTVTDPAKAQELYSILLQNAQLTRAAAGETSQTLLIGLQNGLVLQMNVRDESLMACGTWVCPEFFEAFETAVQ